ncbi:hypothetical protein AB0M83_30460, partial [Amycolatopsis sp. NPDC051106]|uniref:hypothetical protein n=1 Tax=Amycolatopsis sp. NPDC051106 TaxID=3157100 RepID=UPI00343E0F0C
MPQPATTSNTANAAPGEGGLPPEAAHERAGGAPAQRVPAQRGPGAGHQTSEARAAPGEGGLPPEAAHERA